MGNPLFQEKTGANKDTGGTERVRRRFLALAHTAWLICAALALLIFLAAIPLGYAQRFSGTFGVQIDAPGWYLVFMSVAQAVISMLTASVCLALAALLFWKRRQEPMTLFVSFFLMAYGIVLVGPLEALNGFPLLSAAPPSSRSMVISTDVVYKMETALFAVMPLLFYLFPSGRFVPGWTRYLALLVLLLVPVVIRTFSADWPSTVTPFAWIYAALLGMGIYAQIYRYRRVATPLERQQTKWVVFGVVLTFIMLTVLQIPYAAATSIPAGVAHPWWQPLTGLGWYLSLMILPLSLAIAVMGYRLWDIDIIISRTLVYGALTASVVALYVLIVGGLSIFLQTQNNLPGIGVAILMIALLFQPMRRRLQALADRFLPLPKSIPHFEPAEEKITISQGTPDNTLRGHWLLAARLAWGALTILTVGLFIASFPGYASEISECIRASRSPVASLWDIGFYVSGSVTSLASALLSVLLALMLVWRKPREKMAVFVSCYLLVFGLVLSGPLERTVVLWPDWGVQASAIAKPLLFATPTMALLALFPSGKFVPRWTGSLTFLSLLLIAATFYLPPYWWPDMGNPFAGLTAVAWAGSLLAALYAQVYRYRRVSSAAERQQTKWVVFGFFIWMLLVTSVSAPYAMSYGSSPLSPHPWWAPVVRTIWFLSSAVLPVALTLAVLRYRLFDLDLLINRTLVYGALTATVVGLYVLIVGWLSLGLQTNTLPASVVAILIIALLLQPLRRRLQGIADRFVPMPQAAADMEQHESRVAISQGHGAADTTLRGRWLLVARLAWAAVFLMLTVMYAFGFLAVHNALSTVCVDEPCTLRQQIRSTSGGERMEGWPGPPIGFAEPLRPDQVRAVETLGMTLDQFGWLAALQMGIPALIYLLIAAGLFWRGSDNWMVLFASMMVATFPIQDMPLTFTLAVRQPAWEWVHGPSMVVALSCFLIFPLIFPNGRFVPRWTRWMVLFVITGALISIWFRNSIQETPGATGLVGLYVLVSFCTGVYAQVYRYFRVATLIERQQLKWVVVGLAGFVFITFLLLIPLHELLISRAAGMDPARALILSTIPDTLFHLVSLFIPVSVVISVLRYGLWDIDILINRTLVYGALTGIVVSAFVIIVGFLSTFLQSSGNSILAILATGLVALLFNPLRQRLQLGVNRLMYGARDEPYTAISRLGRRLESTLAPEAVLPTVVTTVREVLKLPYVAIYLQQDSNGYQIAAESAAPFLRLEGGRIHVPGMNREGLCMPLVHQGETLGYLVLGPRGANEAFNSTDLHLLEDLAPQVGVAVHSARLTADLQRSREQLVLAREEERRRLRRDLHDGLGPQLAGLALKLETARNRMGGDPQATALLTELSTRTQEAVADIRRLVYGLRPPALDELGLLMAFRESVTRFNEQCVNRMIIVLEAPESLPALPAAVEVAAYRIAQEGLNNVVKHAEAHTCFVRLSLDERAGLLCLEIQDDGKGLPLKRHAGVGLNSMRERAEELGGSLTITAMPAGGTQLSARLPYRSRQVFPDAGPPAPPQEEQ